MLLQSLNLRRLSYLLLTGEKNHFLTQLPSVQEKLVEIFRNVTSPVVQSEVYLCIRVLLCRLSPHTLTSFWPVVLTELVSLLPECSIAALTSATVSPIRPDKDKYTPGRLGRAASNPRRMQIFGSASDASNARISDVRVFLELEGLG